MRANLRRRQILTARNYSVLATTNVALARTNWVNLGSATNLGVGRYEFTDPTATNYPRRFYQLRAP